MHPSEGRLIAHLDGELPARESAKVDEHLAACGPCRRAFVTLQARSAALGRLLDSIETEPVEAEPLAERVRQAVVGTRTAAVRRSGSRGNGPSWWSRRSRLAQAALLLLVLGVAGGLSAALPGSPVRSWLASRGEVSVDGPVEAGPERTAVLAESLSGSLTVRLGGLRRGDLVEVEWIDGGPPRVSAPSGSRYRVVPGVVSAEIARPPGAQGATTLPARITVELPRRLADVVVEAGGSALITKRDGSVEISGALTDSSSSALRFEVGGG